MTPLLLLSCAPPDPARWEAADAALPDLAAYTDACEAEVGPLPPLSCGDVPEVVQTVTLDDGTVRQVRGEADLGPGGTCDRPSTLSGCAPGSRAGQVRTEQGSDLWLLCRVNRFDTPRGAYDDIALIARDPDSGAACAWGAPPDGQWRDGAALPHPGSEEDGGFWADLPQLATLACRSCHDGDGVVVTPWIAANLPEAEPGPPLDPLFAHALSDVDPSWAGTPRWVHPDAAPCRTCHELYQGPTCAFGPEATGRLPNGLLSPALAEWPTDRWMDDLDPAALVARHGSEAGWEASFGAAADRLLQCCGGAREGCWAGP